MAVLGCFPDAYPLNPVNQVVLSLFGANFAPTYSVSRMPPDYSALGQENLLKMQTPGGTDISPPQLPSAKSISDFLAPVMSTMSMVTAFAQPIFDLIQLIIGIINVICSLLDPGKVIDAVIQLFQRFIPKIISYIPPFAGLTIAIDIIKLAIAALATVLAEIVPQIEMVVRNALSISSAITNGNAAVIPEIEAKLCTLFQILLNNISIFEPINTLLDILETILNPSENFPGFCGSGTGDDSCCECPPIILSPPTGNAQVISKQDAITLPGFPNFELFPASTRIKIRNAVATANQYGLDTGILPGASVGLIRGSSNLPSGFFFEDISSFIDRTAETISIRLQRGTSTPVTAIVVGSSVSGGDLFLDVATSSFDTSSNLSYLLQPDEIALFSAQMLTIGCNSQVRQASLDFNAQMSVDSNAWATNQQNVRDGYQLTAAQNGFDSAGGKIGRLPARIDVDGMRGCIARLIENPTDGSVIDCIQDIIQDAIDDFRDVADRINCAAASSLTSDFSAASTNAFIKESGIQLSFTPRDIAENAIMASNIPNTSASVIFQTDLGTITPALLNPTTGTYTATINSDVAGTATVRAFFITSDVCMEPRDGGELARPIRTVSVQFIPNNFRPRRAERQYVQSRGGRRR